MGTTICDICDGVLAEDDLRGQLKVGTARMDEGRNFDVCIECVHALTKSSRRMVLSVVRRDFGMKPEPDQRDPSGIPDNEIQNGVDPETARERTNRSRAAQRRQRDETGKFTRKDPPQKGGDTS